MEDRRENCPETCIDFLQRDNGRGFLDLADALWPTLLATVQRAEARGTAEKIPIVRVLDRATQLANEFPRGSVVIPLKRALDPAPGESPA